MMSTDPVSCLRLEKTTYLNSLKFSLETLTGMSGSFTGLAWQFDHDFLYMSPQVEELLGYPLKKFEKSGVMFLHSITPNEQIEPLYESINTQLAEMEKDPEYMRKPFVIRTPTVLQNKRNELVEIIFSVIPLDYRPESRNAYLSLGTLLLTRGLTAPKLKEKLEEIYQLLESIKRDYVRSNPQRFNFLDAMASITPREKEVAELLCQGMKTREVADQLFISNNTVDTHRKNLLAKFKARNTAELIHHLSPFLP